MVLFDCCDVIKLAVVKKRRLSSEKQIDGNVKIGVTIQREKHTVNIANRYRRTKIDDRLC